MHVILWSLFMCFVCALFFCAAHDNTSLHTLRIHDNTICLFVFRQAADILRKMPWTDTMPVQQNRCMIPVQDLFPGQILHPVCITLSPVCIFIITQANKSYNAQK